MPRLSNITRFDKRGLSAYSWLCQREQRGHTLMTIRIIARTVANADGNAHATLHTTHCRRLEIPAEAVATGSGLCVTDFPLSAETSTAARESISSMWSAEIPVTDCVCMADQE